MEADDQEKYFQMAETSARQALAIDPNIGEAHAVLAQINADRGDLLDAESGFFFAISLEPNEPTPHQWYSILLTKVGRLDAALAQAKKAQELDPTSPILAFNLANTYKAKGEDDAALRYAKLASELGLGSQTHGVELAVAIRRAQWDDARRLIVQSPDLPPELKGTAQEFVDALADPSKRPAMVARLNTMDPKLRKQYQLIGAYMQIGEIDLGYKIMFDALDKDHLAWVHDWDMAGTWGPDGAAMRKDPRFGELTRRIGMLDYWKQYGFPDGCRAGTDRPIVCS